MQSYVVFPVSGGTSSSGNGFGNLVKELGGDRWPFFAPPVPNPILIFLPIGMMTMFKIREFNRQQSMED
jgi:hypothetical protein